MSVTIGNIKSYVNQFIRDTSTYSVSDDDRNRAITAAIKELYTEQGADFSNRTYDFNFFDTINYYDITTTVPDLVEAHNIRYRNERLNKVSFIKKDDRDISVDINSEPDEDSFAIEIKNRRKYLGIEHVSQYPKLNLHDTETLADNGTWTADTTTSDALNPTLDEVEYMEGYGTASINFDISVAQSVNNRATIYNADMTAISLADYEDISSLLMWVYIPDVTNVTSVTAYWGSSATAYWSLAATTDIYGSAFANGWNRIKFGWSSSTKTSTPDVTLINYVRVDINYSAGQADDTDFRIQNLIFVRPEKMTLYYQTIFVGMVGTSGSTAGLSEFTADTNIPYFSGLYDFYDKYVAHKAAATLFRQMGLENDALMQDSKAEKEKKAIKKKFPSSHLEQTKAFKINLRW